MRTDQRRASSPITTERALLEQLHKEFPRLRVIDKDSSPLSKVIDIALRAVTFGAQRNYLDRYVTTLGQRIYVPKGWRSRSEHSRVITMRHEAVHLRQFRRFTWLGMTVLYLVPILPMGLAVGRAWLEWEAYRETVVATAELLGIECARAPHFQEEIVAQFCTGAYGWMWPFPGHIRRRIHAVIEELERWESSGPVRTRASE